MLIVYDIHHRIYWQEILTVSQTYFYIHREDSVISLTLNNYLDLIFDVIHAAASGRYVDGNDINFRI